MHGAQYILTKDINYQMRNVILNFKFESESEH